jgi:hypothetical protein
MAAEIVVIVEDQDFGVGLRGAIEVRRRQTGNARAHHHQVIRRVDILRRPRRLPEFSVAQIMGGFEGTGMAAAHSGALGRIIAGAILRRLSLCGMSLRRGGGQRGGAYRHAIEEIAPVDVAVHAQIPVARLLLLAAHSDLA